MLPSLQRDGVPGSIRVIESPSAEREAHRVQAIAHEVSCSWADAATCSLPMPARCRRWSRSASPTSGWGKSAPLMPTVCCCPSDSAVRDADGLVAVDVPVHLHRCRSSRPMGAVDVPMPISVKRDVPGAVPKHIRLSALPESPVVYTPRDGDGPAVVHGPGGSCPRARLVVVDGPVRSCPVQWGSAIPDMSLNSSRVS